MSVICTGGAALFVWLPLFGLIGDAALWFWEEAVLRRFAPGRKPAVAGPGQGQKAVARHDSKTRYILSERAARVSDAEIALALKESGWADGEIQAAMECADSAD